MALDNIIGSVARAGIKWMDRKKLPQIEGRIKISRLTDSVEILRDKWGIPHIFANNEEDLFFAQGFVMAQDRLWQMELNRLTAQGQLSSLFGEIGLETDRAARTFGFNRLGKVDFENSKDEARQAAVSFSEGVNAFLNMPSASLPVEFSLLKHTPRPWEPEDTTTFMRLVDWQLSHAWFSEIVRAEIIQAVGEEHAAELEIKYPEGSPLILPKGIEFNLIDKEGNLISQNGPFLNRGLGSNNWVVAGNKTDTGMPYLCNDMHLALGMPGIWYQVHLVGGRYNAIGVSLPGAPGIMVGHNDHNAWGITLAFIDCEDLFVEKFDPNDPSKYLYKDEWVQATVVDEVIEVKGKPEPHHEKVIITRHGPVISDVVGYTDQRVAVNSNTLQPCPGLEPWLRLDRAKNWDEFVDAMKYLDTPQLNIIFADIEGNIGYWVTGKVPVRAKGDGTVPVPGWTGEYEWVGEVPFEEMPHVLNPEKGYVVTCNNKIIPEDYPHFLGNIWMNGYRARRIEDVLNSHKPITPDVFKKLHLDYTSIPGKQFVEKISGVQSNDPLVKLAMACLKSWDGVLDEKSVGGCIYEVARYYMARNLVLTALGEDRTARWMGTGFSPVILPATEFLGHDTVALLRLLDQPDSWWIQQAGGKEKFVTENLREAVTWLKNKFGDNQTEWQWGKLHTATFSHALGIQKPLDKVFNRGPYPIGGDTDTAAQTAMIPNDPYENKCWSTSFREIIDLSDLTKSVTISPPGQSGQVSSKHYDDYIEHWRKGTYATMLWTRDQIEKELEGKLVLEK